MPLEQFHYLDLFHSSVVTAPVSVTSTCCRNQRWDSRYKEFITALPKGRSCYLCSWNISSSWIYFTPVLLLLKYLLQLPVVDVETPGVEKSSIPIDGLEHCYWPSICRKAYCRCQSRSLLSRPPKIVPSSGYLYSSAATAPHLLNSLLSLSTSLFQRSLYQDQSSI